MKPLAKRRTTILVGIAVGSVMALFIVVRITRELAPSSLPWVLLGALIGGGATYLYALTRRGADARYQALSAMFPSAVVVQSAPSDTFDTDLARFEQWSVEAVPPFTLTTSLVFDQENVSVWAGGRDPFPLLVIPWSDVTEFGVGQSPAKASFDRIVIGAGAIEQQARLFVGLERVDEFKFGRDWLSQTELANVVTRVNEMRKAHHGSVAAAQPVAASVGLEPGITAWSARRVSKLSRMPIAAGIFGVAVLAAVVAAAGFPLPALVLGATASLLTIAGFIGGSVERRATKRESAAGYTTLNGRELHLVQRHPFTGITLRNAGAPPLSDEDFERALGRQGF